MDGGARQAMGAEDRLASWQLLIDAWVNEVKEAEARGVFCVCASAGVYQELPLGCRFK